MQAIQGRVIGPRTSTSLSRVRSLPRVLTSAANRGASIVKMRAVSRHTSIDVLSSYVRDADAFIDQAGAGLL
jgi:hypothetical protein